MNWTRGLFRAWVCISAIWILAVGYDGYSHWNEFTTITPATIAQKTCADARTKNPKLGNPFDCFDKDKVFDPTTAVPDQFGGIPVFDPSKPYDVITPFNWWSYLLAALGVPALLFGAWVSVRWVAIGFRR